MVAVKTKLYSLVKRNSKKSDSTNIKNNLAKLTLALCPPLKETPRSPTRVMSPSAKRSISLGEKKRENF